MTDPSADDFHARLAAVYREESGRILGALVRLLGGFEAAEDALHDAFTAAAQRWPEEGIPANPRAWLISTARFKAIDAFRRRTQLTAWLNSRAWPPELDFCALTIVRLKKAREYLDDAVRAMESCQEEQLLTPAQLGPMVVELSDLASDVDELIAELRARLERGTE